MPTFKIEIKQNENGKIENIVVEPMEQPEIHRKLKKNADGDTKEDMELIQKKFPKGIQMLSIGRDSWGNDIAPFMFGADVDQYRILAKHAMKFDPLTMDKRIFVEYVFKRGLVLREDSSVSSAFYTSIKEDIVICGIYTCKICDLTNNLTAITKEEFKEEFTDNIDRKPPITFAKTARRIVCAAVRNKAGFIICSPRHFDEIMRKQVELFETCHWEQGFVDQKGNFVTRKEAHVIAQEQDQIIRRCGGDSDILFSENLY